MLASIHIADLGPRRALPLIAKGPSRVTAPGLRNVNLAVAARLGGPLPTKADIGRVALLAMWDDDAALDRFLADAPIARAFADGWHVRLAPLRAHGSWPGLPDDISKSRRVEGSGPVGVFTMGRVRIPRLPAFLKHSVRAEARVVGAPGLIWGTALVRPPFVATCSLWESADASTAYAYTQGDAHHAAIAAGRAKPFHHQEAFVRFRPYASVGHLDGRNPLPDSRLTRV
jgi:heme-degrading monooxygenase HmoA